MTEKDIQSLLNDSGMTWWLDSGSLLGLVRDGQFLKHDHDIDIGLISKEEHQLEALLKEFATRGFRIVRFYFHGILFKCKCVPSSNDVFRYILDIQLYKQNKEDYICPQMVFKTNLSLYNRVRRELIRIKKSNKADYVGNSLSVKVKRFLSSILSKRNTTLNYDDAHSELYKFYYWKIPTAFLNSFKLLNGYCIFEKAEDYLAYRYGEWRIPVTGWVFTRDDHALVKSSYSELLSFFSNGEQFKESF